MVCRSAVGIREIDPARALAGEICVFEVVSAIVLSYGSGPASAWAIQHLVPRTRISVIWRDNDFAHAAVYRFDVTPASSVYAAPTWGAGLLSVLLCRRSTTYATAWIAARITAHQGFRYADRRLRLPSQAAASCSAVPMCRGSYRTYVREA